MICDSVSLWVKHWVIKIWGERHVKEIEIFVKVKVDVQGEEITAEKYLKAVPDEPDKRVSIYGIYAVRHGFPDAGSSLIEKITLFHDLMIIVVVTIAAGSLSTLIIIIYSETYRRCLGESQKIEFIWTLLPAFVLICIGLPSLRLLYLVDELSEAHITVKALGHQWYWQYDYPENTRYDSYLKSQEYRLLDVDHRLMIRGGVVAQILITAADVLHSWTIPTMGIKADAVPGRVNKLTLSPNRPGVYFGQCREICGRNHRFMPISLESYFNLISVLKTVKRKVKSVFVGLSWR